MLEINGAFAPGPEAANPPTFALPALPASGAGSYVPFGGGVTDGVRPNWWNAGNASGLPSSGGSLLGTLQQIINAFASSLQSSAQSVLGGLGGSPATGATPSAGAPPPNAVTPFSSATLSSTGDPHLAFSGTQAGSTSEVDAHFDSMSSHPDLFSTGAFGGYRVSTTVGTPNANGVTTNASATATLDHGRDAVTMNADGTLAVTSDGNAVNVADGTSVTLAGGATVSVAANGAATITDTNARGASLATTFTANGSEVDVTGQAANVALGGYLVQNALGQS